MTTEKKKCTRCYGTGKIIETKTEQDFAMGIALGGAFGTGYFPSTRTVTERVNCTWCHGTGKR